MSLKLNYFPWKNGRTDGRTDRHKSRFRQYIGRAKDWVEWTLEKTEPEANNCYCYIASVNTKRDWLICSHVALDKCNVSRPGNK
jgi:hypothetical protein